MLKINIEEKSFEDFSLRNIGLEFGSNGLYAITGESGSGKSTLLNCIAGLDAFAGTLTYDGKAVTDKNIEKYRRENVAVVFQDFKLISNMNVMENICVSAEIVNNKLAQSDIIEILNQVGLDESYLHKKIDEISMGEMQRVAIARAIAKGAKIVVADEPTANLDSQNANLVMSIFRKLSESRLVIIVSHNQSLVEQYCDTNIKMADGKIINVKKLREIYDAQVVTNQIHQCKMPKHLFKLLTKNNTQKLLKTISLLAIVIVLLAMTTIGFAFYNLTYESALAKTLDKSCDNNNWIYTSFLLGNSGSMLNSLEMQEYVCYTEQNVGIGVSAKEFLQYCDNLVEKDMWYGNNIPMVSKFIFVDDAQELGIELVVGSDDLDENQIIIPSRLADFWVVYGKTSSIFTQEKSINCYQDIVGEEVELLNQKYSIAGIYDSPKGHYLTKGEFDELGIDAQNKYIEQMQNMTINAVVMNKTFQPKQVDGLVFNYLKQGKNVFTQVESTYKTLDAKNVEYVFEGSNGLHNAVRVINNVKNTIILPIVILMIVLLCLAMYVLVSTAIQNNKDNLLVLRAMGMKKSTAYMVYIISTLIVNIFLLGIALLFVFINNQLLDMIVLALDGVNTFALFKYNALNALLPVTGLLVASIVGICLAVEKLYDKSVERKIKDN